MPAAFWVCGAVTVVSAFVSLGYATAALRAGTGAGREPSMYAFVRSLALAAVAVVATMGRSNPALEVVALAMVVVQAGDAVVGAAIHDRLKTYGPAATAMVNGLALVWLVSR